MKNANNMLSLGILRAYFFNIRNIGLLEHYFPPKTARPDRRILNGLGPRHRLPAAMLITLHVIPSSYTSTAKIAAA
jgi:hypothetical protein